MYKNSHANQIINRIKSFDDSEMHHDYGDIEQKNNSIAETIGYLFHRLSAIKSLVPCLK